MRKMRCRECGGRGHDFMQTCPDCNGTGAAPTEENALGQCHRCYGDGEIQVDECNRCLGTGAAQPDQ